MLNQPYQREADDVADKYNHEKAYCLLLFASFLGLLSFHNAANVLFSQICGKGIAFFL